MIRINRRAIHGLDEQALGLGAESLERKSGQITRLDGSDALDCQDTLGSRSGNLLRLDRPEQKQH